MEDSDKPQRLYFKTYLKMVRNAVGTHMFNNFYVHTQARGEFDAMGDGDDSCAFFVSGILVMFQALDHVHGTVQSTIKDLEKSGWVHGAEPKAGDVLVWAAQDFGKGPQEHIGFSIGSGRAISTSWTEKTPVEHDEQFGDTPRKITRILRFPSWDK